PSSRSGPTLLRFRYMTRLGKLNVTRCRAGDCNPIICGWGERSRGISPKTRLVSPLQVHGWPRMPFGIRHEQWGEDLILASAKILAWVVRATHDKNAVGFQAWRDIASLKTQ